MSSNEKSPVSDPGLVVRASTVRGRYAPSPTGPIHLGNARTALVAWLSARLQQGQLVWRLEDLDQQRLVPGLAEEQQLDLHWLGLDWDEGPPNPACGVDTPGPHAPYQQSLRGDLYLEALRKLAEHGSLFPCKRSRREIREIASAPHGPESSPYPVALRPERYPADWFEQLLVDDVPDASIRFRVDPRCVEFDDLVLGRQTEDVARSVGDFVLRRRDGVWAYQFAVVVDDIDMSITEVVRGADLLDSTARQILLYEALGARPPCFAHVPLMVSESGEKLNKRDHATNLSSLRAAGLRPERIVAYLASTLGLVETERPLTAAELLELELERCPSPGTGMESLWQHLGRPPTVVPHDIVQLLRANGR